MVVHDLNICWPNSRLYEADSELVIVPDVVLTLSITLERSEMIARRRPQEVQGLRRIELGELALGHGGERSEPFRVLPLEQRQSVLALERLDHARSVLRFA